MQNEILTNFENRVHKNLKKLPSFRAGDTVRVHYRIKEREDSKKTRIQQFEGIVIRNKRGGIQGSFTVRKIGAGGIGVERVFPLCSPNLEKIEVRAKGIVRRARLYYLRKLSGKAARIKSQFNTGVSSKSEKAPEKPAVEAKTEAAPADEKKNEE